MLSAPLEEDGPAAASIRAADLLPPAGTMGFVSTQSQAFRESLFRLAAGHGHVMSVHLSGRFKHVDAEALRRLLRAWKPRLAATHKSLLLVGEHGVRWAGMRANGSHNWITDGTDRHGGYAMFSDKSRLLRRGTYLVGIMPCEGSDPDLVLECDAFEQGLYVLERRLREFFVVDG